jgi:Na+/proline symporter
MIIMPEKAATLMAEDPQKVLPTLVMEQMPFVMQVLFFGALLSAIKSCASATLLAPSVTLPRTFGGNSIRTKAINKNCVPCA